MPLVNVAQAKAQLSRLIDDALRGDEVIISRRNVPVVRLVLVEDPRVERRLGFWKGEVELAPDFDETPPDFGDYR